MGTGEGARQGCDTVSRIVDRIAVIEGSGRIARILYGPEFVQQVVQCMVKRAEASVDAATDLLGKLFTKSEGRMTRSFKFLLYSFYSLVLCAEQLKMEQRQSPIPMDIPNFFAGPSRELLLNSVEPHLEVVSLSFPGLKYPYAHLFKICNAILETRNELRSASPAQIRAGSDASAKFDRLTPRRTHLVELMAK